MKPALDYLIEDRAIDPAVAEYAAWRKEGDVYVIPYFDACGVERSVRYHRPGGKPKYWQPDGAKRHLYCVENVRYGQVVLCEGEIDTLSVLSAGLKAVGVPGAGNFYRPWAHLLDHVDDLVLAYDNDSKPAARSQVLNALSRLKEQFPLARVVTPPEDQDLNDILKDHGPEGLRELLHEHR